MGTRVFIGRLSNSARERDVERFFKGYGKIMEIVLKTGFGFVEFEDPRDADDAVYDLNNKTLCGERVTIEHARSPNERFQARNSRGSRRPAYLDRPESPKRTDYRIVIDNLSSRVGRQELKEFLNKVGEVTYADVTRDRNEGVAEFATLGDMKNVLTKLNGAELRGRKVRLTEDKSRHRSKSPSRKRSAHSRSRSRSRSRSPRRSRSGRRSRSARRSPSPRRSRSRSPRRSPSTSPRRSPSPRPRVSRSPRASRSISKGKKSPSRSPSQRSASGSRSRSRGRSSSGGDDRPNDGINRKSGSRSD